MEALFHAVFEISKIAVLALFYATAMLLITQLVAVLKPGSRLARLSKERSVFWSVSYFGSALLLLLFMFSYWGDHGLGDSYRMPIGNWKVIKGADSPAYPYIENKFGEQLGLGKFTVADGKLWGETTEGGYESSINGYVIWDLNTDTWKTYKKWETLQKENADAPADQKLFRSYEAHYAEHWNGWRFWLLP